MSPSVVGLFFKQIEAVVRDVGPGEFFFWIPLEENHVVQTMNSLAPPSWEWSMSEGCLRIVV